jgi:hypothetical protein
MQTIKQLFAVSGNVCAFPNCREPLVINGVMVGEMCHIKGAKPTAARYDPAQSASERHSFDNLVLLCRKHHKIIDRDMTYTADRLMKIKLDHEKKQDFRFGISDRLAAQLAFFGAGTVFGEIARSLRRAFDHPEENDGTPKDTRWKTVAKLLKRTQPGELVYRSNSDVGRHIGSLVANVVAKFGWKSNEMPGLKLEDHGPVLVIQVTPNSQTDMHLVLEAIELLLRNFGFEKVDQYWTKVNTPEGTLRVMLIGIRAEWREST